eukprot:1154061-Pelagomonas_calceolata.AAC.6
MAARGTSLRRRAPTCATQDSCARGKVGGCQVDRLADRGGYQGEKDGACRTLLRGLFGAPGDIPKGLASQVRTHYKS